jgi:hypothetical protein
MRARGWHQNGFVASTGALFGEILDQPEGVSSANQRFFTLVGATKSGGADWDEIVLPILVLFHLRLSVCVLWIGSIEVNKYRFLTKNTYSRKRAPEKPLGKRHLPLRPRQQATN